MGTRHNDIHTQARSCARRVCLFVQVPPTVHGPPAHARDGRGPPRPLGLSPDPDPDPDHDPDPDPDASANTHSLAGLGGLVAGPLLRGGHPSAAVGRAQAAAQADRPSTQALKHSSTQTLKHSSNARAHTSLSLSFSLSLMSVSLSVRFLSARECSALLFARSRTLSSGLLAARRLIFGVEFWNVSSRGWYVPDPAPTPLLRAWRLGSWRARERETRGRRRGRGKEKGRCRRPRRPRAARGVMAWVILFVFFLGGEVYVQTVVAC
jgi:hypothetical protein